MRHALLQNQNVVVVCIHHQEPVVVEEHPRYFRAPILVLIIVIQQIIGLVRGGTKKLIACYTLLKSTMVVRQIKLSHSPETLQTISHHPLAVEQVEQSQLRV